MNKWCMALGAFLLFMPLKATAHEHQPGESEEQKRIVEFYKTWHRAKGNFSIIHRQGLCCYGDGDNQDCFPVKAVRKGSDGVTEVMPDTEGASTQAIINYGNRWYRLDTGVEEDKQPDPRTSPDGRSHVCINGNSVLCFVPGYGT